MSDKRSVTLEIAGQRLSVRTDRDNEFLHALADYVDHQVVALKSAAPSAPWDKVCLLVALQLADELFAEREHVRVLYEEIEQRSQHLLRILDRELGEESAPVWSHAETVTAEPALRR